MQKYKRILIDCSDTYSRDLNTGIQRVVRNIVERKNLMESILGIPVIPVVFTKSGYIGLDEFLKNNNNGNGDSLKKKARSFLASKVKNDTLNNIIKLLWYESSGIYYSLDFLLSRFRKKQTKIRHQNGDVLLVIDAFWMSVHTTRYLWAFIKQLHAENSLFIPLMYDIIPIDNTGFCELATVKKFNKSFNNAAKYADHIITISKSEKKIIENHLKSLNIKKNIEYFYLGSNINSSNDMPIRDSLKKFRDKKYFLTIGTIEPRKNIGFVLDVFEQYAWNNGFDKSLVICGKIGWKMRGLINHIENSSYLNDKLFMFNDLNDSELDFLYEHAHALIFASEREGFGLPLVEAINKGLPVIVNDIDVFREVGGDYPVYFKLNDKNSLFNAVKTLENGTGCKQRGLSSDVLTWDESIEMLCSVLKGFMH